MRESEHRNTGNERKTKLTHSAWSPCFLWERRRSGNHCTEFEGAWNGTFGGETERKKTFWRGNFTEYTAGLAGGPCGGPKVSREQPRYIAEAKTKLRNHRSKRKSDEFPRMSKGRERGANEPNQFEVVLRA